ncbi:MAG: GNAT family N-acetyltransferase [Gammaproteobacteria bacterium]|nr:GNAT family N-acetyltransferase [Gammaproteobacteria bacterium]
MKIFSPETTRDLEDYYHLRWQLLRKDWQQPMGSEKDELEDQSYHLLVRGEDNQAIGVGRLHFISDTQAQIRYMAVLENYQGQGVGRLMVQALEQHAAANNRNRIILHARENAVGFYIKLNYQTIEKSHLLYNTIQHYKMTKEL